MALHPDFPNSPHAILDPGIRWFPADETLRTSSFEISDSIFISKFANGGAD